MHQNRLDVECLLQFFNTHGAEVTPGSDVVGEDLQFDRRAHQASLLAILSLEYESAGRAAQCGLAAAQRNLLSATCSAGPAAAPDADTLGPTAPFRSPNTANITSPIYFSTVPPEAKISLVMRS